jgi:hypothetical protein
MGAGHGSIRILRVSLQAGSVCYLGAARVSIAMAT